MISLHWDWTTFGTIAGVGGAAGFFLGPLSWPERTARGVRPPLLVLSIVALATWVIFFGSLGLGRYLAGDPVELQATVLYLAFVVAGLLGLWARVR